MRSATIFFSLVSAAAALRSPGCAQYGCDSSQSFSVTNALPAGSQSDAHIVFDLGANFLRNSTSYTGCVSNGVNRVVCSGSPFFDGPSEWSGLTFIDPSQDGSIVFRYTTQGAGHCTDQAVSIPGAFSNYNLPLFDASGQHLWTWDVNAAAALSANGAQSWQQPVFPATACPGFLSPISATNSSVLAFGVGPLGEAFTLNANGLPDASLMLNFNWTNGNGGDLLVGFLSPIAPLGIIGSRILYLTRFYVSDPTDDTKGDFVPNNNLFLVAIDLLSGSMPRIRWTWTLQLPTDDTVFQQAQCQPVLRTSISNDDPPSTPLGPSDFLETIAITGPTTFPSLGSTVITLSCQGQALSMGIQANSTSEPVVLWKQAISLAGGQQDVITGQAVQPALAGSGSILGAANGSSLWLFAKESGTLFLLDSATGSLVSSFSVDELMASAPFKSTSDCFPLSLDGRRRQKKPRSLQRLQNADDADSADNEGVGADELQLQQHYSGAPGWIMLGTLDASNGSAGSVLVMGVRITEDATPYNLNGTLFAEAAFSVTPSTSTTGDALSVVAKPLWCALTPNLDGQYSPSGAFPVVGHPAATTYSYSFSAAAEAAQSTMPGLMLMTAQGAAYLVV